VQFPHLAFDPLGQYQPENPPAFPENSARWRVLIGHDQTTAVTSAHVLRVQQRFPRRVMPALVYRDPCLQFHIIPLHNSLVT